MKLLENLDLFLLKRVITRYLYRCQVQGVHIYSCRYSTQSNTYVNRRYPSFRLKARLLAQNDKSLRNVSIATDTIVVIGREASHVKGNLMTKFCSNGMLSN